MHQLISLVLAQIDSQALDKLLSHLRILDNELDIKIEDIRQAQSKVSVVDRINIFTNSDAELAVKEENRRYQEIKHRHAQTVEQIKDLIRDAVFCDYSVVLKVQSGAIMKAVAALRVEHRWGVNARVHRYQIRGIGTLKERVDRIANIIDDQYKFIPDTIDAEELMELVYDGILRRGGFVE